MKVYLVVMKDRHVDDDYTIVSNFEQAFKIAQKFWQYFDENLTKPKKTNNVGLLLHEQVDSGGYSVEIRCVEIDQV